MPDPTRLVLATRSAGKLRELGPMVREAGFMPVTLDDVGLPENRVAEDAIEVFDTFEANAEAKAAHFARLLPGTLVLADDSGLVVPALGGAPGVRSKRWAGSQATGHALDADNNAALQRALDGVTDRRAHYACVAAIARANGETGLGALERWCARGEVHGQLVSAPRGTDGFGYDPYFVSDELGVTFGEATLEEKARVSHRARAVRGVLGDVVRALGPQARA